MLTLRSKCDKILKFSAKIVFLSKLSKSFGPNMSNNPKCYGANEANLLLKSIKSGAILDAVGYLCIVIKI